MRPERTLLLVEDSELQRELMARLLRARGYRVLVASDGEEGLLIARDRRPDVIVTDVEMPGMTGVEMARRLRGAEATARIPIVALTADPSRGNSGQRLRAAVDLVLRKPVSSTELLTLVELLLRPSP